MPDSAISILEPVDLRTVWPDESSNFTPWLAEPESLTLLGDELGLTLEPRGTEQAVGSFSADIFCRRLDGGSDEESWVVIENQYGRSDHDHLGKQLTYTAGLNGRTVVWDRRGVSRRASGRLGLAEHEHHAGLRVLRCGDRVAEDRLFPSRPAIQHRRPAKRLDKDGKANWRRRRVERDKATAT